MINNYDKYKINKINIKFTYKWIEKLFDDFDFNEEITDIQIKNFVIVIIQNFHHVIEKKNSIEFEDMKEMNTHDILFEIYKYWYYDFIYNLIVEINFFQFEDNRHWLILRQY